MAWLLEFLANCAMGVFNVGSRLHFEMTPHRDDDPWTLKRKGLVRTWVLGGAAFVVAIVVALFVGFQHDDAASASPYVGIVDTVRRAVLLAVAAVTSASALVMSYAGYRLWRMEASNR